MSSRTNACTELTRLWLETRHGFLVAESVAVPVPYALSDIDLEAMRPDGQPLALPTRETVGPRLIVEAKDEHDWDPSGRGFGQLLRADMARMGRASAVPRGTKGAKFSMLREEHFERAVAIFGTDDFDRLFVVHAIDPQTLEDLAPELAQRRIHWLTVPVLVQDLVAWYRGHGRPAALRHTLVGDLLHLLVGFCGLDLPLTSGSTEGAAPTDTP